MRFDNEFALWDADEASHFLAIATFDLTSAGLAAVEEMTVMVGAENWVPYETAYEKKLVDALAGVWERSVKGLRYGPVAGRADCLSHITGATSAERVLHCAPIRR